MRFLKAHWTVWQLLSQRAEAELQRRHDLDLRAFIALSYVQAASTSPGELAVSMAIPRYEVSRTLARLVRLQAITRRPDRLNARRQCLSVTATGAQLWAAALGSVQAVTGPLLNLPETQLTETTRHLEHLAAAWPFLTENV